MKKLITIGYIIFFMIISLFGQECSAIEKPNVIIILADDMGYGDVSFCSPFARTKTPNIDKLGESGLCFTDAHAGGAVCIPSRYGLLTGRYFFRVAKQRLYYGYFPPLIEKDRETIGSLMQRVGYNTACIGKWHLGLNWGVKNSLKPQISELKKPEYTNTDFSQNINGGPNELGFNYSFILPASLDMPPYVFIQNNKIIDPNIILTSDVYHNNSESTVYAWDRKYTNGNDLYWGRGIWWRDGEMASTFKFEECLDKIVDEGISYIKNQVENEQVKPFMLYLALTGPHTPWLPGENFKGSSELGTYGDFISQIDNIVDEITCTLKQLRIEDNTILIFTSDNGAHWSEEDVQCYAHQSNWGRRGQKGDIWDGGHHVPMFIKWPSKIKKAEKYSHTVSLIDLLATFAEMTGQKIGNKCAEDSYSFYPVLDGHIRKPIRESIIYISSRDILAIQKENWKLINCLGSGGFTEPSIIQPIKGGPAAQLYNLMEDPLENTNLYLQNDLKVKELIDLIDKL